MSVVRFFLVLASVLMLALLALNVALTIDVITRHPFEWLAGALALLALSFLPIPTTTQGAP